MLVYLIDQVWIQDYHLLLVPGMLRKLMPSAIIGCFLHTPFPTSELFRCLPHRKDILNGMLGSNLIGFQTYAHSRHFISSCTRVLGVESTKGGIDFHGVVVAICIFPVGIDVDRVSRHISSNTVIQKMTKILELFQGKRVIFGRDKIDSGCPVHGLIGYEKFLELYPVWRDQVILVQITVGNAAVSSVASIVARINGKYGSLQHIPVYHFHQNLDTEDYYALLSIASVALITSVRDGMSISSHEYVYCQQKNKGVLIMSEFAGSASSFSGALLVNPWDHVGLAHSMNEALSMPPEERGIRFDQLFKQVNNHSASIWAHSFIKELERVTKIPEQPFPTRLLDFELMLNSFMASKRRLLLFDYDGTLTPIVKIPSAALPSLEMLKALEILTQNPQNDIYIISGRDQVFLDKWLGNVKNLGFSAEHGSFLKYPDGEWINLAQEIDFTWKKQVAEIFAFYEERTQGSFTEHKVCSITWHYRLADPDYGSFQAKECQSHLQDAIRSKIPVEVIVGKKNLEVRPSQMNKGEIVKRLIKNKDYDFIFCAGDDRTDEDMFKSLLLSGISQDLVHTCTIGPANKKTFAKWHVPSPQQIIDFIGLLAINV
jgi:trehalose-phosphatase